MHYLRKVLVNGTTIDLLGISPWQCGIISQIPNGASDQQVWWFSNEGLFTVRSPYYLELSRLKQLEGSTSHPTSEDPQWKSIWSFTTFGSIQHFIWRACYEILPTKCNLLLRKITNTDRFLVCTRAYDLTVHALWTRMSSKLHSREFLVSTVILWGSYSASKAIGKVFWRLSTC